MYIPYELTQKTSWTKFPYAICCWLATKLIHSWWSDYLRQRQLKTVVVESRWDGANDSQARINDSVMYVYGGIGRESSTMIYSSMTKLLIQTCTVNNLIAWISRPDYSQRWLIGEKFSSIRITPDWVMIVTRQKLVLGWEFLLYPF